MVEFILLIQELEWNLTFFLNKINKNRMKFFNFSKLASLL